MRQTLKSRRKIISKEIAITWSAAGRHRIRVLQGIARYGRHTLGTIFRGMSGGVTTVSGHSLTVGRTVLMTKPGMAFPQDKVRPDRGRAGGGTQLICQRSRRLHGCLAHG